MKPFGAVFVMLEPSRWQYLITSLLNLLSGIINSDGATYLAAETYTTKVIWKFASANFDHTLINHFDTTTLQDFLLWINPVSIILYNCYFLIFRSIMCWHISQNNLCSSYNLALFLARLMTWDNLKVNSLCQIVNRLHHPQPTDPREYKEPYM